MLILPWKKIIINNKNILLNPSFFNFLGDFVFIK